MFFCFFFLQTRRQKIFYLTKTFLAGPDRRVNDLQEQLTSARVEDEDGSIDWFRCQVALKCLKTDQPEVNNNM